MIKFPFKKIGKTELGIIWRPFAKVWMLSKIRAIWVPKCCTSKLNEHFKKKESVAIRDASIQRFEN